MTEELLTQEAEIRDKPKFSMIWFLPLISLLIGLGLLYNSWQNRGVHIEIIFDTAEGIVPEKTKIKNLDVDIGLVTSVGFSEDREKVVIEAEIDNLMRDFIREDSDFWVVRPRVSVEGVTGIGTLISGAYIEVSPGYSDILATEFIGLESPPVTPPNTAGIHLTLVSSGGKPVHVGNPIIYRGFRVGKVESVQFDSLTRQAIYNVFIRAPYHELVTTNTFFWNVGGLTVTTTSEGLKIDVASIDSLMAGGIQFDILEQNAPGTKILQSEVFTLYDSFDGIMENRKYDYLEYVVLVEDSVAGLYEGATVEYRGIRVGTVAKPYIGFDELMALTDKEWEQRIPVVVYIEPERVLTEAKITLDEFKASFDRFILGGMTASIETSNLLTGALKVSLDVEGEPIQSIDSFGGLPVIPSSPGGLQKIGEQVERILARIEEMPLEQTATSLNQVLAKAEGSLVTLDQTMLEMQETLATLQPGSDLYESVEESMSELQRLIGSLEPLVQDVSNQPNSLIFGGPRQPDIQPKSSELQGQ